MPSRQQRAGARAGALSAPVRRELRAEARRLAAIQDPVAQARAVGDSFAALDAELEAFAVVRIRAIRALRKEGWSYDRIAKATGLSKGRVAQLVHDGRASDA